MFHLSHLPELPAGPMLFVVLAVIIIGSRKHFLGAHRKVQSRGALGAMVIQRWVPPARGFVPAMLGTVRQPFGRFLGYSVIASAVWAVVFILGAHFGGRTLILAIPTVATIVIAIQVTRRLVFWRGDRRGRRLVATT
jgi:membrane protein DedA with SNARE-associated domain